MELRFGITLRHRTLSQPLEQHRGLQRVSRALARQSRIAPASVADGVASLLPKCESRASSALFSSATQACQTTPSMTVPPAVLCSLSSDSQTDHVGLQSQPVQ